MNKKLNLTEKKLKFHCSVCFTAYQLSEIKHSLKTNSDTKCLNNCFEKWESLLITYCREQIILDITKKEQKKDEEAQDLTDWLNQINKQNKK